MYAGRRAGKVGEPVAAALGEAPGEREVDPVIVEHPDQRAVRYLGDSHGGDGKRRSRRPEPARPQNVGRTRLKRRICQIAATPSFQSIFFPSAYVRPEYVICIS